MAVSQKPAKKVAFFIPHIPKTGQDAYYQSMINDVKYKLGCKITGSKIYSLDYIHDKKPYRIEVGGLEPIENLYKILAIFEANVYIVFTKAAKGDDVLTLLVNKDEVQAIEYFA